MCIFASGTRPASIRRIAASYERRVTPKAPWIVISLTTIRSLRKSGTALEALDAGEHDAAAGRGVVQRLGDRLGGVRGHLDDDVGAAPVGQLLHAAAHVLASRRR